MWTKGKKCRFCRKLTRKELMRFEALRKKTKKIIPRLKSSYDGLKDELNQRIENEGVGAVVSWMKERYGSRDTYSTLKELYSQSEAVRMMTGEDGRVAMSDLLEFMGRGEAMEYLDISEKEDESMEGLSKGEIREQKGISKQEDESMEEMDPFETDEMLSEMSEAERGIREEFEMTCVLGCNRQALWHDWIIQVLTPEVW